MKRLNALAICTLTLAALVAGSVDLRVKAQSTTSGAVASDFPRARFHHVHMNSVDPDAAISFYTSRFKSSPSRFAGQPALSVNGMWFLFNKVPAPAPAEPIAGFWHIGWGSPDMKGTYDSLLKSGTKFQTPLTNAGEFLQGKRGPLDFMYAYGPGGEWIELYTTDNTEFHHVHLLCADAAATQAWYLKYFGTPNGTPRKGPGGIWIGDLNLITAGTNAPIAPPVVKDRTSLASPRGRVLDHFAFQVQDLNETLARLRTDGVTVLEQPKVILDGTLRSAFVQAPDNVQLELVELVRK
jgi:catechol 2,3-dioxygenase-like lactoylglutathione lyase family enzyme